MNAPSARQPRELAPATSRIRSSWILVVIGWLVTASWCLADEPPKLRRDWHELRSPNFVLYGDASKRQMETVAESLESLRAFLGTIVEDTAPDPMPTYVYVFRDDRSFKPYELRRLDGKPRQIAGYYTRRPHAHYIVINASIREALVGITQHEYVHAFTRRRLPPVPLWFKEGLAEFYSTFETEGDHVNLGKIVDRHLEFLRTHSMIPLLDFLSVSMWSPEYYDEGSRRGVFYAQSWLLVHYLFIEAEGGMAKLVKFLELEDQLPRADAFQQAFGMEPAQMEKDLRRYMRSRRFGYRRAESPLDDLDEALQMRKMSEAEALARLGEMVAMQGVLRFKEGDAHVRAALAREPDLAAGHAGLGLLQLGAAGYADYDEMARHFQKAHELAPEDPVISFLFALARARRGDNDPELRNDLIRLVNADPRYVEAWRLLAWAWADESEQLDAAIRVFEGAHKVIHDEALYAEHLLRLYRAAGRADEANALIESYFKPRDLEPATKPKSPPLP